jgi:hypothetical protein
MTTTPARHAHPPDAEGQACPAPGTPVTAALPRSPLHLRLLRQAEERPAVLLYRDAHLAQHMSAAERARAWFLGREQRWPGSASLRRVRAANGAYYRSVRDVLGRWEITRLILFLESEPLENCVRDVVGDAVVELWEEGLSHYADFHGPVYDRIRSAVQLAAGFYPRRIFRRRADRDGFARVRDRFVHGGLPATPPVAGGADPVVHEAALLIGAPLIQDRIVSRRRYLRTIEWIVACVRQPVVYYPHPREDTRPLAELETVFGPDWFRIAPHTEDLAAHVAGHRYACHIAAFSTALLDVAPFGPSAFCPALFGLRRVHRQLAGLSFLPAHVVASWSALTRFSEAAQAHAHGAATAGAPGTPSHEPAAEIAA